MTLLVFAVAPALCEELAFRGFILSGLGTWDTNGGPSSSAASCSGPCTPYSSSPSSRASWARPSASLRFRPGSLLPAIVFHVVHNSLVVLSKYLPDWLERNPALRWVRQRAD